MIVHYDKQASILDTVHRLGYYRLRFETCAVEDGEKDLNFMGIYEGANPFLRTQNNQTNQKAN